MNSRPSFIGSVKGPVELNAGLEECPIALAASAFGPEWKSTKEQANAKRKFRERLQSNFIVYIANIRVGNYTFLYINWVHSQRVSTLSTEFHKTTGQKL